MGALAGEHLVVRPGHKMNRGLLISLVAMTVVLGSATAEDLERLDLSAQLSGYFFAQSGLADETALGGFGSSPNAPRPIADDLDGQPRGAAQKSRLPIVRAAVDKDRQWKPIETLSRSFCGNSYHRVRLPAHQCWVFSAPAYGGSQHSRMRFRCGDIVSNEFDGTVNLAQFSATRSR